jgi:hypothetical protein
VIVHTCFSLHSPRSYCLLQYFSLRFITPICCFTEWLQNTDLAVGRLCSFFVNRHGPIVSVREDKALAFVSLSMDSTKDS